MRCAFMMALLILLTSAPAHALVVYREPPHPAARIVAQSTSPCPILRDLKLCEDSHAANRPSTDGLWAEDEAVPDSH